MGLRPKGTGNPITPSIGEPGIVMADGATAPSLPNALVDCGEPGIDTADGAAAPSLPVRGDSIVRSPIRSYPPEGTVSWRTCKLALLSLELKKRKIEFVLIRQGMKRCVSDLTCCIPRSPVRRPLPCVTTSIGQALGVCNDDFYKH